jgi:hypothetical protein
MAGEQLRTPAAAGPAPGMPASEYQPAGRHGRDPAGPGGGPGDARGWQSPARLPRPAQEVAQLPATGPWGPVRAVLRREPGAGQVAGVPVCQASTPQSAGVGTQRLALLRVWSGRASAYAAGVRPAAGGVHCPRAAGGATASGSRRPGGRLPAAAARLAVRQGSGAAARVRALRARRWWKARSARVAWVHALSGLAEGQVSGRVCRAGAALPGWLVTKLVTIRSELS